MAEKCCSPVFWGKVWENLNAPGLSNRELKPQNFLRKSGEIGPGKSGLFGSPAISDRNHHGHFDRKNSCRRSCSLLPDCHPIAIAGFGFSDRRFRVFRSLTDCPVELYLNVTTDHMIRVLRSRSGSRLRSRRCGAISTGVSRPLQARNPEKIRKNVSGATLQESNTQRIFRGYF